jgi:hypothetical protein
MAVRNYLKVQVIVLISFLLGIFFYVKSNKFSPPKDDNYKSGAAILKKGECRILSLGDSMAFPYPENLEEILNRENIGVKFSVVNKALGSVTSTYVLNHLEKNISKTNPDIVLVIMGINDGVQCLEDMNRQKIKSLLYLIKPFWNKEPAKKVRQAHPPRKRRDIMMRTGTAFLEQDDFKR